MTLEFTGKESVEEFQQKVRKLNAMDDQTYWEETYRNSPRMKHPAFEEFSEFFASPQGVLDLLFFESDPHNSAVFRVYMAGSLSFMRFLKEGNYKEAFEFVSFIKRAINGHYKDVEFVLPKNFKNEEEIKKDWKLYLHNSQKIATKRWQMLSCIFKDSSQIIPVVFWAAREDNLRVLECIYYTAKAMGRYTRTGHYDKALDCVNLIKSKLGLSPSPVAAVAS